MYHATARPQPGTKVPNLEDRRSPILIQCGIRLPTPPVPYSTMRNQPNTPRVTMDPRPTATRNLTANMGIKFSFSVKHESHLLRDTSPQGQLAWPASLDVPALLGEGWRPSPFREFIVKVHSRCDLSCDYCYMYELTDQSWRDQPRAMSEQTADMAARRIGNTPGAQPAGDHADLARR